MHMPCVKQGLPSKLNALHQHTHGQHSCNILLYHNMGKKRSKKSKTRTPKMDKIDQFFADYPDFDYDRTKSSPREFYRMCDFFDWGKNSRDEYPAERLQAQEDFRRAMVENFNDHFGTDVDDQQAWEHMCVVLGIEPLPGSMNAMKAVCLFESHAL